jgi:hypothetical protein
VAVAAQQGEIVDISGAGRLGQARRVRYAMTVLPPPADAVRVLLPGGASAVVRLVGQEVRRLARRGRRPDSDLYAESSDADPVIGYIVAHA